MEVDSPHPSAPLTPRDRVVERLKLVGVPARYYDRLYAGLVEFVRDAPSRVQEIVSAILPTDEEVSEAYQAREGGSPASLNMKEWFRESMFWLQWLMFEDEPSAALKNLAKINVGQRGVCGAVWGNNDIAYRCRTCENDPTCAICVRCFENGNHKDHDYSIIYTGGGCCDCGDETAWKREGFCSKHRGTEQIQPLPEELRHSVGPVLDALLICWRDELLSAQNSHIGNSRLGDHSAESKNRGSELTFVVVEMLLEFCKHSESLLCFVSKQIISSVGLLDALVHAERHLSQDVTKNLHKMLLKLLGEPVFKSEFAKVFVSYYPVVINKTIKECSDSLRKEYPLLPLFSVQIFTVPTLTPRLVKEMNLLGVLFGALRDILVSCVGDNGKPQGTKYQSLHYTAIRVIGDIQFVLSHVPVSKYATQEARTISGTWLRLLTLVQGMNPLKRETGIHIEEENDSVQFFFILGHSISVIHSLLLEGAFAVVSVDTPDDSFNSNIEAQYRDALDGERQAKGGRLSQDSSVCSTRENTTMVIDMSTSSHAMLPSSVTWLISECLRILEYSLGNDVGIMGNAMANSSSKLSELQRTLPTNQRGEHIPPRLAGAGVDSDVLPPIYGRTQMCVDSDYAGCNMEDARITLNRVESNITDLSENTTETMPESPTHGLGLLGMSDWPDIHYDVSSQDISIHIPLHRFLALLLKKALKRLYGPPQLPDMISANLANSCSADFFGYVLGQSHPCGFCAFIMEHVLRIRAFCAQVNAGMWRKNGVAALVSSEWYRSGLRSEDGLELDLFLLQCCGAIAPADLYVYRLLDRFGLSGYLSLNLAKDNEFEPVLVQEMLTLIIQILQERRFCGFTTTESLRRELICKLAVGDSTHSRLVKSLPHDLSKFEQLQEILDSVAVYSNPSGYNQGKYSLRSSCWKELDLYHPRWNARGLQAAEERYSRNCGVSALTTQLPKWLKIYPPLKGLAKIATCKATLQIVFVVLYYAISTDKPTESRAPDNVLISALHLLSLSLDVCIRQKESSGYVPSSSEEPVPFLAHASQEIFGDQQIAGKDSLLSLLVLLMRIRKEDKLQAFIEIGKCDLSIWVGRLLRKFAELDSACMNKLKDLAPEVVCHMTKAAGEYEGSPLDFASDAEKHKAKARERQAAILAKMKAAQNKFISAISSEEDDCSKFGSETNTPRGSHDLEITVQEVCSLCHDSHSVEPVSYLIFLQKSKLLSFVDRGPPSWKQTTSENEKASIATRRATDVFEKNTVMDSPRGGAFRGFGHLAAGGVNEPVNRQPGDIYSVLDFFKAPMMRKYLPQCKSSDGKENTEHAFQTLEQDMYLSIQRKVCNDLRQESLLQEEDEQFGSEGGLNKIWDGGQSALLGKCSSFLTRDISRNPSISESSHGNKFPVEPEARMGYGGLCPADCDGIHLMSCGHAVHQGCLERYLTSLRERSVRRNVFEGAHIVDPDQGEFLCPVCRRLANSVFPADEEDLHRAWKQLKVSSIDSTFLSGFFVPSDELRSLQLWRALCLLRSASDVIEKDYILKAFPPNREERLRPDLELVTRTLSKLYFPKGLDRSWESSRVSQAIIMWDTFKYTLMSTEIAARSGKNTMLPIFDIDSLYEGLKTSNSAILSSLIRVVQSIRSANALYVHQRFRGAQLFAESIGSGIFFGFSSSGHAKGIPKHVHVEESSTALQFWNRASDPVLASDPFSSFLWVLFCLPAPFISCKESLLALVHLFYVISLTQAVIAYSAQCLSGVSKLDSQERLVADILKMLREHGCLQQYFVSNYTDSTCDMNMKETVRRCTFPYLRRCALFWRLLNLPSPAAFHEKDQILEGPSNTVMDFMDVDMSELNQVQLLEKMFEIPPVDVVLDDELVRLCALSWLQHLQRNLMFNRLGGLLYVNPLVPFRLMNLPYIYQDLLQRYIKRQCPDCEKVNKDPSLCLLCGRLCNSKLDPCCRDSDIQTHAAACGSGIGVFLLIKRTTILLQRGPRQASWPSPYLDAYGEEDIEMQRGKPLYLNEERYATLNHMVASQSLDQNTTVLALTTMGSFFIV